MDDPHGRLRLFVAGGLGRARLFRLLHGHPLLRFRPQRARALELFERPPDLRLAGRRRRSRLLQQRLPPDLRPQRSFRPERVPLSRRRFRAGVGQRPPAAPARLLEALCCRASSPVRNRFIYTAAGLGVLIIALGIAAVLYRKHQGRDIRGNPTVEFVESEPKPVKEPPHVTCPLYGYDAARLRAPEGNNLRPPFRHFPVWTFRGRSLLEFPPVISY